MSYYYFFATTIMVFYISSYAMDLSSYLAQTIPPKTVQAQKLFTAAQGLIKEHRNLDAGIEGQSPLLIQSASNDENLATTILLLAHNADPNIIDQHQTPLLCAARACAPATVRALLFAKANPNHPYYQQTATRLTPLHCVCDPSMDVKADAKKTRARLESLEWLLAASADTNAANAIGSTPLFGLIACYRNFTSTPMLSPQAKKNFHNTRKQMINAMLSCKANPYKKTWAGLTPFNQGSCQIDGYLSIYLALRVKQRREKLRSVLHDFLRGSSQKPERISPFKNMPSDIIRYILKIAYP